MAVQESLGNLKSIDFSNLDINNIGAWPLVIRVVLWAMAFCLVVGGLYKGVLESKHGELATAETKEAELRQEFEGKVEEAANLDAYRAQMKEMENAFSAMLSQLPTDTEVPGLLDDISKKGDESGLIFDEIDLKPEVMAEFYVELPIQLKVVGWYHEFGSFISGVAGLPRIVTLHDFVITRVGAGGGGKSGGKGKKGGAGSKPAAQKKSASKSYISSSGQLTMDVVAKTYRYKKEDETGKAASDDSSTKKKSRKDKKKELKEAKEAKDAESGKKGGDAKKPKDKKGEGV